MQVPAACVSGSQKVYGMSHAILLYSERGGQTVFASIHDVSMSKEGGARIEAGTPVSKTGLVKMMQTLLPEDYAPAELLGNHILAKGSDHLVWYCKPRKRRVWFKNDEIGHDVSAATHQPGLVFVISKEDWSCVRRQRQQASDIEHATVCGPIPQCVGRWPHLYWQHRNAEGRDAIQYGSMGRGFFSKLLHSSQPAREGCADKVSRRDLLAVACADERSSISD